VANDYFIYDEAIVDLFTFFTIDKSVVPNASKAVPIVFEAPHRALARLARLYPAAAAAEIESRPFLPAVSVWSMDPTYAADRFRMHPNIRLSLSPDFSEVTVSDESIPQDIIYQIDMWAETRTELNELKLQYTDRFRGEIAYVTVNLEEWGSKLVSVRNDSIVNNSDLEPGEGERVLRLSATCTLRARIRRAPSSVKVLGGDDPVSAAGHGAVAKLKAIRTIRTDFYANKDLSDQGAPEGGTGTLFGPLFFNADESDESLISLKVQLIMRVEFILNLFQKNTLSIENN